MRHKHGCLFKRFEDAFHVFATVGSNMLMEAPEETGVRVIRRFESDFALLQVAIFLFLFVGLRDVSLNRSDPL